MFKSDRGGIEIDDRVKDVRQNLKFKSDRGGIEIPSVTVPVNDFMFCSNQTVAGLK